MTLQWIKILVVAASFAGANLMAQRNLRSDEASRLPPSEGLIGVDGVLLVVDVLAETATTLGIESATIAGRVDRQLRAARIRNLSREESVRQGAAELCVSIHASKAAEPAQVAYCLSVKLREPVLLVRDRARSVVAVTWQSPGIVAAGQAPLSESIMQQIDEQVEYFIRSFREANPDR
jgi:hypothetical protein